MTSHQTSRQQGSQELAGSAGRGKSACCPAFTLIELLTVVGIIALLLGVTFPVIRALTRSGATESGVNTINVAVGATRVYATTLPKGDLELTDGSDIVQADFSGCALIFTPSGELRFVENSQVAKDGNNKFLEPKRNGYTDIPKVDYAYLPKNTGVVGIARGNGGLYLLAPPFAVHFNRQGNLVAGISNSDANSTDPDAEDFGAGSKPPCHRLVFYDANYNNEYLISDGADGSWRGRPFGGVTPYNPDRWDANSPDYDGSTYDTAKYKQKLPFERLETVVGVIVFAKSDLRAAGLNLASEGANATTVHVKDEATEWIVRNGKPIFFSRLTGRMMREQ